MARPAKFLPAFVVPFGALLLASMLRRAPIEAAPREADAASERLTAFEALRRSAADFAELPTWDTLSGPDPYLLARLPAQQGLVGILRGADAVVLLDSALGESSRLPAPASPTALAIGDDGSIFVAGELSRSIARFRVEHDALVARGTFTVPGVGAIRGLAAGPGGWLYMVEEHRGRLLGVKVPAAEPRAQDGSVLADGSGDVALTARFDVAIGEGPIRLERVGDRLIADCLLDHALVLQKLEPSGMPSSEPPIRIVHDGPIWSFAARPSTAGLRLAAAGVEDHPLDRTIGAFGYIDSFLYLYEVDFARREVTRRRSINLSELGVVTPKAVAFAPESAEVVVAGYGSDRLVRAPWGDASAAEQEIRSEDFVPGTNAILALSDGAFALANPLLDAWILYQPGHDPRTLPVHSAASLREETAKPLPLVRLGEALFFTTAMAPWNRSDGPLSRFTCETCHYEGYVDGRTHHTGRGDVHAVTKPLLGLFNNRPHFSRALDDDLTTVAFNEFNVANLRSGHDAWFDLSLERFPWLRTLGLGKTDLSPELLRKGLMSFLMSFNHRPNPMALGRSSFSPAEQLGAATFRDRCESCHQARLLSDSPDSRVPFEKWEALVLSKQGPIVWGIAEYKKTGVLPYVHDLGARVPSLRRLYKKRPYFTNGSAKSLSAVLEQARFGSDGFWHHEPAAASAPSRAVLADEERRALLDFLDLL